MTQVLDPPSPTAQTGNPALLAALMPERGELKVYCPLPDGRVGEIVPDDGQDQTLSEIVFGPRS
jgi:hypothetical protein